MASENTDVVFMATAKEHNMDNLDASTNLWIADSAASSSVTNTLKGMTDLMPFDGSIQVGNGEQVKVHYKGTFNGKIKTDKGCKLIKVQEVLVAFDFIGNLFSITKALSRGAKLESENDNIVVKKGDVTLVFDEKIKSGNGYLLGCEIVPNEMSESGPTETGLNMKEMTEKKKNMKVMPTMTMHMKLGHVSEAKIRATAKRLNIKLHGKMDVCSPCAEGKAKQVKMNKESEQSNKIGERLYLDLSTIKKKSYGQKHHWILLVDDHSRFKWSLFVQKKSDLAEEVYGLLKQIKNENNIAFKSIRCDNAGENKKLQELLDEKEYGAKFEYTAPGTPQQNGVVERAFATLYGKVRAMLNWAGLSEEMRTGLWAECASTATKTDNLLVDEFSNKCPYEKFFNKLPKYHDKLHIFGEVGVIKNLNVKMQPKLDNKGTECLFVGYSDTHSGEVCRMFCPKTRAIRLSRDIAWLDVSYGCHKINKTQGLVKYVYDDEDVESMEEETDGGLEVDVKMVRINYNQQE